MNKLTTLLLCAATILTAIILPGCTEESKTYRIGVSQCSADDWRNKMNEEIEREILVHPEATVEIRSADDSNEKQIADIEYFVKNGFDIIIVAPNEAKAITPAIEKVYRSGMPVIVFDRNVTSKCYTAFQGGDNFCVGESAGQYAVNLLKGHGKVLELTGLEGSTPADARREGFKSAIARAPGISIAHSLPANWNYERAYRLADSILTLNPDINLIYAHNDRMAIAASEAAKRHKVKPYILGIDAAPEIGMKAVKDSVIDATFLYPTEGHRLIRTALAILKGEPYDTVCTLPSYSPVNLDNADILIGQNEALKEETSKMKSLKSQIDKYWDQHSAQTTLFYAFLIFVVILLVLFVILLRTFWARKKMQDQLLEKNVELEKQHCQQLALNEQLKQATQSKLTFFTYVSHDLRTPLTLIAEPIEQLVNASNLTPQQHRLLQIADKNARILKRLINQILDFRTYENDALKLNLTEIDFGRFVEECADTFRSTARKRDITLTVNIEGECSHLMAVDTEKMERVIYNLISNAIKYTPQHGAVTISGRYADDVMRLTVADNGNGIHSDDQKHIFERFFRADEAKPHGSGIGLALTKAFVEMHGGTITLESVPGEGSVFTVTIPVVHISDRAQEVIPTMDGKDVESELSEIEYPEEKYIDGKPLLLVIDDNEDIRRVIAELFSDEYNVLSASHGKEGVRLATRYVPDLIICDVMMPVMDGLECCRLIKEEISTSHIPVLMLTACSMDEDRMAIYDSGADGYLPKPFSSAVMRKRIASLIANRKRIKNIWGTEQSRSEGDLSAPIHTPEGEKRSAPSSVDSEFYARFVALMEKDLGNPDLNVDQIAAELGLGRSQFYRKIKALTKYSPVELIRNMRLKRARQMLTTTTKSISEIAYEVGFSTPAYFTKCYREAFGETPTELRTRLNGDKM